MGIRFNADEIFEIAERIEKNGNRYYKKAAEIFSNDEKAVDILNKLAAMEEEHRIIFSAMRAELSETENETTIFDPEDRVKEYLKAIADGNVFDMNLDVSEELTGDITIEEIFRTAIGKEKDSIIFYLGMKDFIPERLGRNKIDHIINEEKSHITLLAKYLEDLKK